MGRKKVGFRIFLAYPYRNSSLLAGKKVSFQVLALKDPSKGKRSLFCPERVFLWVQSPFVEVSAISVSVRGVLLENLYWETAENLCNSPVFQYYPIC